jgi:hypothetical protein
MKMIINKKSLFAVASVCVAINAYAYGPFMFGIGSYFPTQDRTLGTVTIAADTNYDGVLNGSDVVESPNVKRNPPGLIVGVRELARVDLSVVHNASRQTNGSPNLKYLYHKTAAILDLRSINLGHRRGRFNSFEEEQSRCGRVLVWLEPTRKTLLLDSSDPERRRVQWPAATSLPPKHVYVEGVSSGDSGTVMLLSLLLDDTHLTPTWDKLFGEKACWDALMFSVCPSPRSKPFMDNPVVWRRL